MARSNQSYAHAVVGSSNPSPMEDSSNLFYLYNGDHSGFILVSHHLSRSNYNTWSRAMMMALTVKNKVGFINGCTFRPVSDNPRTATIAW
ncbi:hypothetical protein VitviT2T_027265 [Vitis vinifera]|uniref:Retrotransposon Copia-like N-terminal domain-containing protein n=1 Tax=Vitis vinifera TaxID=29760 RepID=A0ABY9DPL8_VITVI|nr:hypothetical protein VitviT2T_027265 [Vitis vinifera]